ncbi:MAG: hypothetical protein ABL859_05850 [Methylotenera sp.]
MYALFYGKFTSYYLNPAVLSCVAALAIVFAGSLKFAPADDGHRITWLYWLPCLAALHACLT